MTRKMHNLSSFLELFLPLTTKLLHARKVFSPNKRELFYLQDFHLWLLVCEIYWVINCVKIVLMKSSHVSIQPPIIEIWCYLSNTPEAIRETLLRIDGLRGCFSRKLRCQVKLAKSQKVFYKFTFSGYIFKSQENLLQLSPIFFYRK